MTKEYDLVIIGGGPGGYVAAIRAAQLGMKVAIVEKDQLGGTCLHKGCIPSKALLRSAEVFRQTKQATKYGIDVTNFVLNFSQVQSRKTKVVKQLYQGVRSLLNKHNISTYQGIGRILGPSIFSPMAGTISIEHANGDENTMIVPKNIIIATGSRPATLQEITVDGEFVMTSDEALEMAELPKSIVIVGGGVIGIEWASMLNDFGVKVTVIEYSEHILPTEDHDISTAVEQELSKQGIKFIKDAKVSHVNEPENNMITIHYETAGDEYEITAEKLLLSVGRTPNTDDIGINNTSIVLNNEFIETNEYYQTKESHIYAIGDVIGGRQLAHVASHEGITAVEHIAGQTPYPIIETNIPSCVYSYPEIASIGLTETAAKDKGFNVQVGQFPFQANGKALVYGDSTGFVKVIANKDNNDILGIHMIGPFVTELISEASLAKLFDATPWELTETIHPHPTLSETIGEAALAVEGLSIHS